MGKCAFRLLRLVLFVLALSGLVLSGYLMYLHGIDAHGGAMPRLCGGAFDCSTVLQSSYAMIGGQIPVAALGFAYFVVVATWILFVGRLPGKLHHACIGPTLLATAGAIESVFLIYVMGWKLHAWCSFCLATHVVNLLLFAGLWAQWLAGCRQQQQPEAQAVAAPVQLWKIPALTLLTGGSLALALLAIMGGAIFAIKYFQTAEQLAKVQQDADYQRWQYLRTGVEPLAVTADDAVRGPADAPHTIVMFGDFQCQWCAQTDKALREVQTRLGDSFRLVFRHYPQSHACNPAVTGNQHAFACLASQAAEAARLLGGDDAFWKMHDMLYDRQDRLAEKPYAELARAVGLDPAAFEKAMNDPAARQRIERDAAIGKQLALEGTPTLFLDGRRVTLDIITDVMGSETDLDKTVAHWRNLLAAASHAAATQPALPADAPATQPIARAE